MVTRIAAFLKSKECNSVLLHLALCAVFGAIFGALFTATADPYYLLMMRSAASSPVSIVGLMVVALMPFLICLLAVSLTKPLLIYPICFCRIFLYSAGAQAIHLSFGSAGWLMGFLVQFSDFCLIPVLFFFAFRILAGKRRSFPRDAWICLGISVLIIVFDRCIISPFTVRLIDTYESMGRYAISCWI